MSKLKRAIGSSFTQHGISYVVERFLSWTGVRVGHVRRFAGEAANKQLNKHHIFMPLAGSYEASVTRAGGHMAHCKRTVGQASIVPAGWQYSAIWKDEL